MEEASPRDRLLALNYAAAIFTSAFLLFQVQPLVSKHILPWFGGSAAVWTTCLLFFQTVLFFGYAYAHWIHTRLDIRKQVAMHMGLILAAIALAPVLAGPSWEPRGGEEPVSSILLILIVSIGLPYFVLSATGPLLQAWFARSFPGRSPYRLYALSNVGSLLALLSFPFFFERHFSVPRQAGLWRAGFLIYAALCAYAAWRLWQSSRVSPRRGLKPNRVHQKQYSKASQAPIDESESRRDSATVKPPNVIQRILWLVWPMFASIVLMATTNHVSTDIAVMPFLWIAPLALYLLTFIIAFDRPGWYFRMPLAVLLLVSIYITALVHSLGIGDSDVFTAGTPGRLLANIMAVLRPLTKSPQAHISTWTFLAVNFAAMFFICLLCHGELYRQRPDPRYLTAYYLLIALGGALGGVFVTFIAPLFFATYYEWELSLFIAIVLAIGFLLRGLIDILFRDGDQQARRPWHYGGLAVLAFVMFVPSAVAVIDLIRFLQPSNVDAEFCTRSFFGTLSVEDREDSESLEHKYLIKHGTIIHRAQFSNASRRREAITYYGNNSGIERTIGCYRALLNDRPMKVGVLGLGVGTISTYVNSGDTVTFYEINPAVIEITESARWFTYLRDSRDRGANCDVRLGDGRITLRRELRRHEPQQYHVLVLDAFSGDSIPAHLLTVEAFAIYLAHLIGGNADSMISDDEQGAIAVHISNRYLDLKPVIRGIADRFHLHALFIANRKNDKMSVYKTDWAVLTQNDRLYDMMLPFARNSDSKGLTVLWTDSYSSIFDVLK